MARTYPARRLALAELSDIRILLSCSRVGSMWKIRVHDVLRSDEQENPWKQGPLFIEAAAWRYIRAFTASPLAWRP
jgi:hypothetical protein